MGASTAREAGSGHSGEEQDGRISQRWQLAPWAGGPGSDQTGDRPLRRLKPTKAPAVGTTQPGPPVSSCWPQWLCLWKEKQRGADNRDPVGGRKPEAESTHKCGRTGLGFISKNKKYVQSNWHAVCLFGKLGVAYHSLSHRWAWGLPANWKPPELAKLVTRFPKNADWLCYVNELCFQKFREVYRFQLPVTT